MTVVLVLGATGTTGSAVVEAVRELGLTVRTATRASVPRFDWYDPTTYRDVLDGVARIYLVAPVGDPDPIRTVQPFLDRALHLGVERVVMLSSSAVAPGDPGLGMVDAAVRKAFPEWEILRPSWFMQNFIGHHPVAESIRTSGEFITATGDGRLPFIDARDIGHCAARLLASPRAHNTDHRLTGPEALSYDDAAAVMTAVTGRTVRHRAVDADQYIRFLVDAGYGEAFASALAALDERIRTGEQAVVTDVVQRLTGQPPRSFQQFLRAHGGAR
jgi:uncharacterized protein YbjT (DUF2867 family)